jgi:hypothetical protein
MGIIALSGGVRLVPARRRKRGGHRRAQLEAERREARQGSESK